MINYNTNTITGFKNIHKNKDVYVLGSGGSLNFIDPKFFYKKITVCVNEVGKTYLPTTKYVVTKYHPEAIKFAQQMPNTNVVVSRGSLGGPHYPALPVLKNLYTFDHNTNKDASTSVVADWPLEDGSLYVSWSSITSAMHFAAFLGAKNIIMVAHDCGELDDKSWVNGYVYDTWDETKIEEAKERNKKFEIQSIAVKGKLKQLYGCNVYSLNPFINYNLEGVKFRSHNEIN
jgi:hypothetical protein